MKSIIVLLFAFLAIANAVSRYEFDQFISKHNKNYQSTKEYEYRYTVFENNAKRVDALNAGLASPVYGITKFMDLTPQEFKARYLMSKPIVPRQEDGTPGVVVPTYNHVDTLPTSFDWRDKSAVTPVKNQEQCGSCWAFSTTEEIESMWILSGKTEVLLSEQQIVDCDKTDDGCGGGDTPTAYEYVISAGGLETEADYPYVARDTRCTFDKSDIAASITGWSYITKSPASNETKMQTDLVASGPLSICVDAASWQFYKSGVITKNCGQQLDHCVQVVGYNAEGSVPYWIVRNSWGTDWGLEGYLEVEMGKNMCGIADEVTIAVV